MPNGCLLRKTVLAVADAATLDAIAAGLGKDRGVKRLADGSLESVDDAGFTLGFAWVKSQPAGRTHPASGQPIGVWTSTWVNFASALSHIVYFVPDVARAEAFYVERLGFRCIDRFTRCRTFATRWLATTRTFSIYEGRGAFHFPFQRSERSDAKRRLRSLKGISPSGAPGATNWVQTGLVLQQLLRMEMDAEHGSARQRMNSVSAYQRRRFSGFSAGSSRSGYRARAPRRTATTPEPPCTSDTPRCVMNLRCWPGRRWASTRTTAGRVR